MYLTNSYLCFFAHMPIKEVSHPAQAVLLAHYHSSPTPPEPSHQIWDSHQEGTTDKTLDKALVRAQE